MTLTHTPPAPLEGERIETNPEFDCPWGMRIVHLHYAHSGAILVFTPMSDFTLLTIHDQITTKQYILREA